MTEKEKRTLKDGVKNLIDKYKVLEHGIIEVLENNIFSFIDSLQDEPVSIWHDIEELPMARECEYILVIYKDTTAPRVAGNKTQVSYWDRVDKWSYLDDVLKLSNVERAIKNLEEPVSEDFDALDQLLAKYAIDFSYKGKTLKECSGRYRAEIIETVNHLEPVSEDLVSVAEEYAKKHSVLLGFDCDSEPIETGVDIKKAVIYGAKWQKQQDQETIELAEDHAMLSGMNIMEQQMMAKAIDAELYSDGMFIPLIGLKDKEKVSDIKFGDKVKVIIIKEDEL